MKENSSHTVNQIGQMSAAIIAEGLLVGVAGGLTVLLYRIALNYASECLDSVLAFIKGNPLRIAGWFVVLAVLAVLVRFLIKWEPMIEGGGIPQIREEINGTLSRHWRRVLPAKFAGGFLCILGGLSLGRCGPSIQLGAMAGQGMSQLLGRGEEEERHLMTCGAGAGLAATFHAPLAGMIFAMEAVNKRGSMHFFVSVLSASVAADYFASHIIGNTAVFQFQLKYVLHRNQYWMLFLLGILLGAAAVFYNWAMLNIRNVYKKLPFLGDAGGLMTVFFLAGLFGLLMPSVLGGGSVLIVSLTEGKLLLGAAVLALVVKFLFSGLCFASGAPGGSVFPILTLGALIGGIFAMTGVELFGLDSAYINNFVLLAMAGFFSATLQAPVTGIVLLFEMSGTVNHFLSLSIVCLTAYIVSEGLSVRVRGQ